jgi:autotransporter-associated beta strand protein
LVWDTTSLNWGGLAWNSAAGDGAIFGAAGIGAISMPGPIGARSLNFTVGGYSIAGPGPLSLSNAGASTLAAGAINVDTIGNVATINTPIISSVGMRKLGSGTLELSAMNSIGGTIPLAGYVSANVLVNSPGAATSGSLRLLNATTLPASTSVALNYGTLDIGSNNVTLGGLVFVNPSLNEVTGTGTLRVNGEIHVLGDFSATAGNIIYPDVDLGGGTQMVRVGVNTFFNTQSCQFRGTLSNGALFKSYGLQGTGNQGQTDGLALFGNNTYTGATTINGYALATGTNATTSLTVSGASTLTGFNLQGANGSLGSATTINAIGGSGLRLDNNAAIAIPLVPAAQNNDRIRDDAAVTLRDGTFALVGLAATPASETFGSLSLTGGQNTVTLTPTTPASGGTATLTCAGNLTMSNRATLTVTTPTAAPLGGASSRFFINGTLPAADATGILPRIIGNNTADFQTYSPVTGLTPYTSYTANSFATPGVNVNLTAATPTAGSVAINALRSAGTFTTTLTGSDVLTVSSGMVYSTTGTNTFGGSGTLSFGGTPGVLWGTNILANTAALTGTQGLILGSGTLTLAGNLAGLTGMMTVNSGTLNFDTATFSGPIEVRSGTLALRTSQSNLGTILLGVPEQDPNLLGTVPSLSISGAPASSTFNATLVVDNGTTSFAGNPLTALPGLSPLSNSTGSQTWNGNILLNTPLNLQGGGGSGTGATNFIGTISGPAMWRITNGRVNLTASSTLSNLGGIFMGNGGNTAIVSLLGTATGNGPITIIGGNNTSLSYAGPGSLPSGTITIQGGQTGNSAPRIAPLSSSTINNPFNLVSSDVIPVVAGGITATWAGPMSGNGTLSKTTVTSAGLTDNTGTLIVSNPASTFSGPMIVGAGTLGGSGTLGGAVTVNTGGTLAPGSSIGTMNSGNLSVTGTLATELNFAPLGADLVNVTGTVTLNTGSALNLSSLGGTPSGKFIIVLNDGSDPVSGTFGGVNGLPAGATVNYAFSGTDSLGRVGDGNDIAIQFAEPCYANCDDSTTPPILNVNDFICFNNRFAAGDSYANCDQSTFPPVLNVNDFSCFMNKYAVGCP